MKGIAIIVTMLAALGLVGCGGSSSGSVADGEPEGAADAAQQQAAEQQVAARQAAERERRQAGESARTRLQSLRGKAQQVQSAAGPVMSRIDPSLRDSIADLEKLAREVDRRIENLSTSDLDGWKSASEKIESSMDDLEARLDDVAGTLDAQKQVLDRRREEERKPVTGLFEGLDGGDYEAYRVSLVRDVQRALRDKGYYPGPVDGYLGRPTMEALAAFQRDRGVQPSGVPSPETRDRLLSGQG